MRNRTGSSVDGDRTILGSFYDATNYTKGARGAASYGKVLRQDGWDRKCDWKSSAPMGEWLGVITNAEGRVTGLELAKIHIEGAS